MSISQELHTAGLGKLGDLVADNFGVDFWIDAIYGEQAMFSGAVGEAWKNLSFFLFGPLLVGTAGYAHDLIFNRHGPRHPLRVIVEKSICAAGVALVLGWFFIWLAGFWPVLLLFTSGNFVRETAQHFAPQTAGQVTTDIYLNFLSAIGAAVLYFGLSL